MTSVPLSDFDLGRPLISPPVMDCSDPSFYGPLRSVPTESIVSELTAMGGTAAQIGQRIFDMTQPPALEEIQNTPDDQFVASEYLLKRNLQIEDTLNAIHSSGLTLPTLLKAYQTVLIYDYIRHSRLVRRRISTERPLDPSVPDTILLDAGRSAVRKVAEDYPTAYSTSHHVEWSKMDDESLQKAMQDEQDKVANEQFAKAVQAYNHSLQQTHNAHYPTATGETLARDSLDRIYTPKASFDYTKPDFYSPIAIEMTDDAISDLDKFGGKEAETLISFLCRVNEVPNWQGKVELGASLGYFTLRTRRTARDLARAKILVSRVGDPGVEALRLLSFYESLHRQIYDHHALLSTDPTQQSFDQTLMDELIKKAQEDAQRVLMEVSNHET